MKLFISQPMRGKSDSEILNDRKAAIAMAKERLDTEADVIDSFFQGAPADASPLWCLGESLKLLGSADAVYFADGWEQARGYRIEHAAAVSYGINIIRD